MNRVRAVLIENGGAAAVGVALRSPCRDEKAASVISPVTTLVTVWLDSTCDEMDAATYAAFVVAAEGTSLHCVRETA